MIFLFTTADKPFARLIRWGLGEDCSHFALVFWEEAGDDALVIESRLDSGVKIDWLGTFKRQNKIVHALQAPLADGEEGEFFRDFGRRIRGRHYDSYAMAYWIYAGFARKLFGQRLPHKNALGKNELVYCVEIMQEMEDYLEELGVDVDGFNLDMVSPGMAYDILRACPNLREVEL